MNVGLLREIQKIIEADPEGFDMVRYAQDRSDDPCGTAYCIAGHAILLSEPNFGGWFCNERSFRKGMEVLELTYEQAEALFHTSSWPSSFRERLLKAWWSPKENAKIGVERIDHFIATEGRE
jgi:hypothetical protein